MVGIILDKYLEMHMAGLAPHHSVADLHRPGKVGDQIKLPRPMTMTLANWFSQPPGQRNEQQEIFLRQLASS